MEFALYLDNIYDFKEKTKFYFQEIHKNINKNRYLFLLNKIDNLKFSRLYFGSEFCERLIPTTKELEKVINFCKKNKINLTFMTPIITDDPYIENFKKIFKVINDSNLEKKEVIFNDWGVFRLLKKFSNLDLVLGRFLTKQKKDPSFIEDLFNKNFLNLDNETQDIIKKSTIDTTELLKKFLKKNDILRAEFDNVYQGINIDSDIKKTLYYPFVPVCLTRLCKAHSYVTKKPYIRGKNECMKECKYTSYTYSINNVHMFLKGNVQFYCNNHLPKNIHEFDRIVFEPFEFKLI